MANDVATAGAELDRNSGQQEENLSAIAASPNFVLASPALVLLQNTS